MKKYLGPIAGLGFVALLTFVWLSPSGLQATPRFQLTTLNGETVTQQDLLGKPAFITFWATSCVGCVAEQPYINELQEKYAARGLNILAIAMDFDPIEHIHNMREERQLRYPIAHDINGAAAKAFGNVRLTPTNILLSPDGRILFQKLGEIDFKQLGQQIEGLL